MAVYVDVPVYYPHTPLRYKVWSHLWADTLDELHAMADAIGLQRSWFQCKTDPAVSEARKLRYAHYDVTPSKRKLALALGAIPMERREWYHEVWLPNQAVGVVSGE